jgi:hypothetical protein
MPFINTPTALDRMILRGKHESVTKSFSWVCPFDHDITTSVVKSLRHDTPLTCRTAVRADPDVVHQVLI